VLIVLGTIGAVIVLGSIGGLAIFSDTSSDERSEPAAAEPELEPEPAAAEPEPEPETAEARQPEPEPETDDFILGDDESDRRAAEQYSDDEASWPEPTVVGSCQNEMTLQAGEGCRYTGSQGARVVLSVRGDGSVCREGGPVEVEQFGLTVEVTNLSFCRSDGFERDDTFGSDIVIRDNADGSWTVFDSPSAATQSSAAGSSDSEEAAFDGGFAQTTIATCDLEEVSLASYRVTISGTVTANVNTNQIRIFGYLGQDNLDERFFRAYDDLDLDRPGSRSDLFSMTRRGTRVGSDLVPPLDAGEVQDFDISSTMDMSDLVFLDLYEKCYATADTSRRD